MLRGVQALVLRLAAGICIVALAGCTSAPVQETASFAKAATDTKASGDLIWDKLAVNERKIALERIDKSPTFASSDAYYLTTLSDPPATAIFRSSLTAVSAYASMLADLTAAKNVEAAQGQIFAFVSAVADIAALAPGAGLPGLIDPKSNSAVSATLRNLLAARSIAQAKQLAIQGAPGVHALIARLRDSTPDIFDSLVHYDARDHAKVNDYKVALSNFVVTLDRLDDSLSDVVTAFQRPSNPATLAVIVQRAAEVQSGVKAVREVLAKV
jgi:hypothetical protein